MGGYWRFAAMIVTSTLVMFALMYMHTYQLDHVYFSETRAYMALVMGAAMAIVMLSFMFGMYQNRTLNMAIYAGAAILLAAAIYLTRSQALVGEVSYMKAMIPHHSIAILTSERAEITDPRVRKLADQIIRSQREEIAQMRALVAELERR
jgi:FlaA1/EpsC-like NDP-sugar epimerase